MPRYSIVPLIAALCSGLPACQTNSAVIADMPAPAGNGVTVDGQAAAFAAATWAAPLDSELARTAAAMQPGEWRTLATDNLLPTLTQPVCGATGSIFPYSEDAVWDPRTRRVLFIGSDHIYQDGCPNPLAQRFISYNEATNSWSTLAQPGWFSNGVRHGYDHSAIDVARGVYYHYPYGDGSRGAQRYDLVAGTWLAPTPAAPTRSCCAGVEYFPEFAGGSAKTPGGLVLAADANVWVHRTATNQWSGALSNARLNFGEYHTVAEYNPAHKVVIFGGGEIYNPYQSFGTLYKLTADGKVTPLAAAPFNLRVNQSILTVDPVSGDYLVFGPNGEFYVFDVVANRWTAQDASPPFARPRRESRVTAVDLAVAVPISTYGVVMFVKHIPGNAAETKVYLYRHNHRP